MPESKEQNLKGSGGALKTIAREAWEIIKVIVFALLIVLPFRYFIAQPFIVRGASMEPNFEDKEYLVIDELTYRFREPERGEVIVFRYPKDPQEFFIKRIIGLPGERVELKSGHIKIFNSKYPEGFVLQESYLPPNFNTYPEESATLGPSEYFVLGDNRPFSADSRYWGPLDKKFITGRVLIRAWPVNRMGFISGGVNY